MTPHRRNGRGTLVIDRCFDTIGRIHRSSGTNDASTYRAIDAMLTSFMEMGRPDLLEEIRDGRVKAVVALGWFRLGRLDRIPTGESLRPLKATWETWVKKQVDIPHRSRQDLGYTLVALIGRGAKEMTDATLGEVPGLLTAAMEVKADHARTIQKMKAHVQAFLRDIVGDDHKLYRDVRRMKIGKVVTQREGRPLLPEEIRAITARMKEGAGDVWTLCATGMLPKEFWGVWRLGRDRVEIDGTKRKGRKRIIPRWMTIARPSMGPRKLAALVTKASGGTVQLKDFRDTFARWMREAGISSLNRQFYMGHGPRSMTEHYEWGELPGQLVSDAQKLNAFVGGPGLRLHKSEGA